jgi:hypothetical protein
MAKVFRGPTVGKTVRKKILGKERIEFLTHALRRMKMRGISETDVFNTIEHPDKTGLRTGPGKTRVRKKRGEKTAMDVIYELRSDAVRIISTHKTLFEKKTTRRQRHRRHR